MALTIYILEDNQDRRKAMRECLADRFYQYKVRFFVTAKDMIDELKRSLSEALLICLDHDLEPEETGDGEWPDPGDGRMVSDYLSHQTPVCPIIIHTTNVPAAVSMESTLREADWETSRVTPYSDLDWIAESWLPAVRRAIVDAVGAEARSIDQRS